jgi:hypothetical protein
MFEAPSLAPEARRLLALARKDRTKASDAVSQLGIQDQVALICEAPVAHRGDLLGILPAPEEVIPLLPEAELCFTAKAIGLGDAAWMMEYATPEQWVACVDLDVWSGATLDCRDLDPWFSMLADTSDDSMVRGIHALDPEVIVLFLASRIAVDLKPSSDNDWMPPEGGQTLDGQFYFIARSQDDDLASITTLLRTLFEHDYWLYFRLLQGVVWELPTEGQEWAYRWRTGRLQDLGFPTWDEAMRIYRFLDPGERSALAPDETALDTSAWQHPVESPSLPVDPESELLLFRAIAGLEDEERRACFSAFVTLANGVAVADRMELSDVETTPKAIAKAAHWASRGLEWLSSSNAVDPTECLRRATLERLFRVGANLDPDAARPPARLPEEDSDESTVV